MSILTCRELAFLASLKTSWRRLYWNELVHLLKQDDHGDAGHEANSNAHHRGGRQSYVKKGWIQS